MPFEANIEHRGRSRHRRIAPLPSLTCTGRVRRGTKGKPEHGCVFCGKVARVYTRREHLRRHQSKHKKGAYPCVAPGCTCTFHNPALLDRHIRHDWCFPFELPETYLFRCPSHPEISRQSIDSRSVSATPATPSDDGIVSSSPIAACTDSASSPEETFNTTGFSSRSQYLQIPDWNNAHTRQSGGHSHRPTARPGYSSPAIMQSTQIDPTSRFSSGCPSLIPESYIYYTFGEHIPGSDLAARLDRQAEDGNAAQVDQPVLHHTVSLGNDSSMSNFSQLHLLPLLSGQHVEPRYNGHILPEIDPLSGDAYFHALTPLGTEHNYDALRSSEVLDQSLQSFNSMSGQPTIVSPEQGQEQTSFVECPSSSGGEPLQSIYWMARTNASRKRSTGNLDLQFLGGWSDEQR